MLGSSAGYDLPSGDTLEPDVSFLSAARLAAGPAPERGRFLRIVPDLVVEILSDSTAKRDRGEGNNHPTVKPVELMRWLVRLVKGPQDNLILDPFAGSGTTGVACALEGVPCVLVEREAEYVEIMRRRLADAKVKP